MFYIISSVVIITICVALAIYFAPLEAKVDEDIAKGLYKRQR